jgi:hypothetical protein
LCSLIGGPSPKEKGMALAECIKTDRDDKLFTTVRNGSLLKAINYDIRVQSCIYPTEGDY